MESNRVPKRRLASVKLLLALLMIGILWVGPSVQGFVLNGMLVQQSKPPTGLTGVDGAYYYKVASSFANDWTGIECVVQLGVPQLDPKRFDRVVYEPLDGFNVYLGGNAGGIEEIDAGLAWGPVIGPDGRYSQTKCAYHAFWRNDKWNDAPVKGRSYWYPGEVVKVSVVVCGPGKLRLKVSDLGPNPQRVFTEEFDAPYFGVGLPMQFKRVNDIAQVGNEKKPVIPTCSQVVNAIWLESYFLRNNASVIERVASDSAHSASICWPPGHCEIVKTPALEAKGGDVVSIYGNPLKTKKP